MVEGLPTIKFSKGTSKACIGGKHVEHKYDKGKARRDIQVLDPIHSYLIGPLPTSSYGNSRYVLNFIEDFSRYCWVYFLKQKFEVFETFKVFKDLVENMCGNKIKVLRTYNGKEYIKNNLQHIFHDSGIHSNILCPTHHNKMVF